MCWEEYGGSWGIQDPSNPSIYYAIRFENMIECCGSDADDMDTYLAEVRRVDLSDVPSNTLDSALQCCGVDFDEYPAESHDWIKVECLIDYGAAAPMGSYSNPSYPMRARAAARRAIEELIADDDHCSEMLERPVNALGSTAAEFARGDFDSAMTRGVVAGRTDARIMAKMGGIDQQVIDDIRPEDWLPYFMGYQDAMAGAEQETGDISPEYYLGYERGENVKSGAAPVPGWINN